MLENQCPLSLKPVTHGDHTKEVNKRGAQFIFRPLHIAPRGSDAVKVSGRDEKELLKYAFPFSVS